MQDEVNAAIEGAVAAGRPRSSSTTRTARMANLDPRKIAGGASYLSGRHKPMYMVEGLDDSFDAVFLVGYHGSISGRPSTLSHTYNPEVFAGVRVNGEYVGESGVNALPMAHYGIPIALVSGDRVTAQETGPFAPDAVSVITKESITRAAALNLHPDESCRRIRCWRRRSGPPGRGRKRAGARDRQAGDSWTWSSRPVTWRMSPPGRVTPNAPVNAPPGSPATTCCASSSRLWPSPTSPGRPAGADSASARQGADRYGDFRSGAAWRGPSLALHGGAGGRVEELALETRAPYEEGLLAAYRPDGRCSRQAAAPWTPSARAWRYLRTIRCSMRAAAPRSPRRGS